MSVERFIGLSFLIVTLSILIITFYPKSINIDKVDVLDEIVPATKQNLSEFKEFKESDFDFFVYRAHILSSEKNAIKLSKKIKESRYDKYKIPKKYSKLIDDLLNPSYDKELIDFELNNRNHEIEEFIQYNCDDIWIRDYHPKTIFNEKRSKENRF